MNRGRTAFSPGPWREGPTEGIGQRGLLRVVDRNGLQVADCEAPKTTPTTFARPLPEDTANARLIAAAPELLAALKAVLGALPAYGTERGSRGSLNVTLESSVIDGVIDAIAKAEGRQE